MNRKLLKIEDHFMVEEELSLEEESFLEYDTSGSDYLIMGEGGAEYLRFHVTEESLGDFLLCKESGILVDPELSKFDRGCWVIKNKKAIIRLVLPKWY